MKTRLHIGALTLLLGSLVSSTIHAEGSRQLTPDTKGRAVETAGNDRAGFLEHDANFSSNGIASRSFLKPAGFSRTYSNQTVSWNTNEQLYVRMKPGEKLLYGVQRAAHISVDGGSLTQNDLIIKIYRKRDDVEVMSTTLARNTASTNQSSLLTTQAGVIATPLENQTGPEALNAAGNPIAGNGYTPLVFTNASQEEEYYFVFSQVGEASMVNDQRFSTYNYWDFTVRDANGAEKPGRLFSKQWAFSAGATAGLFSTEFKMYPLVPSKTAPGTFYTKEFSMAGISPQNLFRFVTNSMGTTASSTDFSVSRRSRAGEVDYPEYLNFVNIPDPTLWPTATAPIVSVTPQSYCRGGVTETAFSVYSDETGLFTITIDLPNPTYTDRTLTLALKPGYNSIIWDGKDGASGSTQKTVANNTVVNFNFVSSGAPVNFPVYDAEANGNGFKVRNAAPILSTTYDRLYWDNTNITNSAATASLRDTLTALDGYVSTAGVHAWSGSAGNVNTVNTWTYGFTSFDDNTSFTYTFKCDNDGDGVTDDIDIDDDNDGILDVVESYSGTSSIDPGAFADAQSPIRYLDVDYVHPVLGAFRDVNSDGVNDIFDADLDGIPNHFDLDSDGDGLTDSFEAGITALAWTSNNLATRSAYSATQSRFINTSGTIANAVGTNGLPNAVENRANNNTEVSTVKYALADTDGDTFTAGSQTARNYNFLDADSDNDGITDEMEALSTSVYTARSAQANFNTDTNKNGLRDAYDPSTGGTAIDAPVNTDAALFGITGDNIPDMLDFDSDNDNVATRPLQQQTADWTEGFDTNQDGVAGGELLAKARLFATNNPEKAAYYRIVGPASGVSTSPFLQDDNKDNIPNFLDSSSTYYHDDNFNGLVDLFDPAFGGSPSSAPKAAGATEAAFRTNGTQVPLPVELLRFQARPAGPDALLTWATASEKNSARFEVERSTDAVTFVLAGRVEGQGTVSHRSDYSFTDKNVGKTAGTRYYRLRQVDQDGTATLSSVQVVTFDGNSGGAAVTLYPSPTHDNATLDLLALPAVRYTVEIMAADGRRVASFETAGGREVALPVAEYAKGVYLVRVSGQGQQYLVKLLKN